jgi:hypothetical protein
MTDPAGPASIRVDDSQNSLSSTSIRQTFEHDDERKSRLRIKEWTHFANLGLVGFSTILVLIFCFYVILYVNTPETVSHAWNLLIACFAGGAGYFGGKNLGKNSD